MKKVLALVLAVVMVAGMASIATFAADPAPAATTTVEVKVDGKKEANAAAVISVANGKEVTVELKATGDDKDKEAYTVKVEKTSDAKSGSSLALKSQSGKKFTFVANCKPTTKPLEDADKYDFDIVISAANKEAKAALGADTVKVTIKVGVDAGNIVDESVFEAIKEANKDADVKASVEVGPIQVTNITTPKSINKETNSEAPSAIAEALKGKNYAYAGFKYVQALPGVGTMKIDLNAELLLAGATRVYVYEVNGDTFSLVSSSASDKMFEVKDNTVEFPVSRTSQWVVTDKALSSTSTGSSSSSNNNNPGTGANDMVGAAVVMALVAGAGIVAFKK